MGFVFVRYMDRLTVAHTISVIHIPCVLDLDEIEKIMKFFDLFGI